MDLWRAEVTEPGGVVGRCVRPGKAAHDLEPVTVGSPRYQRVQALLSGERIGELGAPAGEGGDPPFLGVRSAIGVPGLVGAEEIAQPEVHQPDGCRGPAPARGSRQYGGAHSLKTVVGCFVTRSTAVSRASSSSSWCSATSLASTPASMRRAVS